MPFNNPTIAPPPFADPWVDEDGVLNADVVSWFLIVLLPAISQSPSVFSSSGPVLSSEQSAAIPVTPLPLGSISAGMYRVSAYLRVTQPDGVASSVTPQVSFVNDGVTCTATGTPLTSDAIDEPNSSTFVIQVDAPGPISFGTIYSSNTPGAMEYKSILVVERLQ
jgi:hypothetical protein